jgi:hypothetical protein
MSEQPQGKSMRELREIVAADQRRWEQLGELWGMLTADEQEAFVALAKRRVGSEATS